MKSEGCVKMTYMSKSVGSDRGKTPGRWKGKINVRGAPRGGGLDQASNDCFHKERWRLLCCNHPFGECSEWGRGVSALVKCQGNSAFSFNTWLD